jgi:hypothetical protein
MNEWINLREERDFGEKFNVTFQFARQNFKNLGLCILFLGTPLMILAGILTAYFQMNYQVNGIHSLDQIPSGFFGYLTLFAIANFIAYTWLLTITLAYIYEYLGGNRNITPGQVFSIAISKFGKISGASIVVGILTILGMVVLLIPGIYLAVALIFVSAIIFIEDDPTFEAITRSIRLIKGKWWSTFGLVFVMAFVVGLMQFVFSIPSLIIAIPKALHQQLQVFDIGSIIGQVITSIGTTLLYPLVFIAIAFQYFNLVERKESAGLKQQIRMAGTQVDATPKNEGEY